MRRRRVAFKPAAILADEIALSHRARDQAPRTMSTGAAAVSGIPAVFLSRQAPPSGCQRSARVRVGLSAALYGPSNPAGILQGAPGTSE